MTGVADKSLIRISDVTIRYGSQIAVGDVCLDIPANKITGFDRTERLWKKQFAVRHQSYDGHEFRMQCYR